ncbi:hypothetical protein HanIR_Chr13g0659161 [Helianthus annuus]|nr:hypothetical protein HanIR_Chr13g0659161 [Helianthus annuus]
MVLDVLEVEPQRWWWPTEMSAEDSDKDSGGWCYQFEFGSGLVSSSSDLVQLQVRSVSVQISRHGSDFEGGGIK